MYYDPIYYMTINLICFIVGSVCAWGVTYCWMKLTAKYCDCCDGQEW